MSEDTSVISGAEGTAPVDSQTTEETTAMESDLDSTDTSSEDVKTPVEEESEDLEKQALGEVKAPKSVNRVQELANRARMAEQELERLKQMQQYQYAQMVQQQQSNGVADPVLQQQILLQEQRLRRMEEQQSFAEAERLFPELDRNSPSYNKDFDDLVFNTYRAEGIAPKEAAAKVRKLLKIGASKAVTQLEEQQVKKAAASTQAQTRSAQQYDDSAAKAARERLRRSGKLDDLVTLLSNR